MKSLVSPALLLAGAVGLNACAASGVAFHERAQAGLSLGLSAGATPEPVEASLSYKREVFAVIPRNDLTAPDAPEAQSLISTFEANLNGNEPGFRIFNAFATGAAANLIADSGRATALVTTPTSLVSDAEFTRRIEEVRPCQQALLSRNFANSAARDAALENAARQLGWRQVAGGESADEFLTELDYRLDIYNTAQLRGALCTQPAGGGS